LRTNSSKTHKMTNYVNKRFFDSMSIDKFNTELENSDWNVLYNLIDNCEDSNIVFNKFSIIYNAAFDKYFPEILSNSLII
jgi:hypothetical protein